MSEFTENKLGFMVHLKTDHQTALTKTIAALKEEGFGVLTEIDVSETMKKKLNVEFPAYKILGVCNPPLALRSLTVTPEVGLLLPCNVTVRELEDGHNEVALIDPQMMLGVISNPELEPVAREARARLERVVRSLEN